MNETWTREETIICPFLAEADRTTGSNKVHPPGLVLAVAIVWNTDKRCRAHSFTVIIYMFIIDYSDVLLEISSAFLQRIEVFNNMCCLPRHASPITCCASRWVSLSFTIKKSQFVRSCCFVTRRVTFFFDLFMLLVLEVTCCWYLLRR